MEYQGIDMSFFVYALAAAAVFVVGMKWHAIMVSPVMPPETPGKPPYLERAEDLIFYQFDSDIRPEYRGDDQRIDNCGAVLAHSDQEAVEIVRGWLPKHFHANGIGWGPARPYVPEAFQVKLTRYPDPTVVQFRQMTDWDWKHKQRMKLKAEGKEVVHFYRGDKLMVVRDNGSFKEGEIVIMDDRSTELNGADDRVSVLRPDVYVNNVDMGVRTTYIKRRNLALHERHKYNE